MKRFLLILLLMISAGITASFAQDNATTKLSPNVSHNILSELRSLSSKQAMFFVKGERFNNCGGGTKPVDDKSINDKPIDDKPRETINQCAKFTYSNCPSNCVVACIPSACSKPDSSGSVNCTSDCDGKGSCK